MAEAEFFLTVEQTLTLPYQQNPARYDGAVVTLNAWLDKGYDANSRPYSNEQMQMMRDLQQRLVDKKAADTWPRIGGSVLL